MFITGKRPDLDDPTRQNEYKLPAIVRNDSNEISLGKALFISTIAHPLFLGFLWLLFKAILLLFLLLGITLPIFDKPQPKVRDIEFVLVNKQDEKPINPNTQYRADRNSRAGGKNNPNIPVSEPEPFAARSTPQSSSAAQSPSAPHKQSMQHRQQSQQSAKHAQKQEQVPPRPMPLEKFFKSAMPKRPNAFSIPVPRSKAPRAVSPGGPVTSGPIGYSSEGSEPSPVMGSGGSRGSRARQGSGYSAGGGNAGNPSPGNPSGRPGIDAVREPDFGPYMRELQRRIKRNWDPPKGNESKRVVIIFKVSRDGRLLSLRVLRSSGVPEADSAAKSAVELTAPFSPLPPEYKGNDIDIQFTFDYNVFSVGGRRY